MKQKEATWIHWVFSLVILLGTNSIFAEPFDGYTLFNPNGSRVTNLIDMDNRVQHSWNHDRSGGYGVYLLENGNLLRPASVSNPRLRGGAYAGLIQEKDWDGNLVWEFEYSSATYITHHDIEPMPNGNVLAIAWEVKSAAEGTQAGRSTNAAIWPDHIIEVEPDGRGGAEIVWEWHAWDHLIQDYDNRRDNYGVVGDHPELFDVNMAGRGGGGPGGGGDWLHINGISYNPTLDQIVISSHFANEIYVIDHSTTTEEAAGHEGGRWGKGGDILYRWGYSGNYDANGGYNFDVVHCCWWIPEGLPGAGNILAFNNGEGARISEIVEIAPPRDDEGNYIIEAGQAFGPGQPVWTYSDGRNFFSNHLGGCQRLPNGNTLISESTEEHLFEVNVEGDIVWEYNDGSEIARSLRYSRDYPGLYLVHPLDDGDIVINEFLAENTETEADQDGEYDGWIELFNNTDNDVSLWGFSLSNDADVPTMWEFPDVTIEANGYLIVWADNDVDQDGLHASFELAAEGGTMLLSAPDETSLDFIESGEQTPDRSYGRYPNGTGEFALMIPSFGYENNEGILNTGQEESELPIRFSLLGNYPNPFNPSTTISFNLNSHSRVRLAVFNNSGLLIATLMQGELSVGSHEVVWDGTDRNGQNVSSGTYFYSLETPNQVESGKAILLR